MEKTVKRIDWTAVENLAEFFSTDEIVKYLKLGRISDKTRKRIEDMRTQKRLKSKLNAGKTLKKKAIQGNISALKTFTAPEIEDTQEQQGIPQIEYARLNGISKQAVNQKIKAGTIGWNGKHGKACRVWDISEDKSDRLAETKIEKLQLETALKRQQLDENRRSIFREVSAAYIEATKTAFAPLHAEYVKLRLNDEQLAQLREIGQTVIQSFERLMNEYIESYLDTGSIKPG